MVTDAHQEFLNKLEAHLDRIEIIAARALAAGNLQVALEANLAAIKLLPVLEHVKSWFAMPDTPDMEVLTDDIQKKLS